MKNKILLLSVPVLLTLSAEWLYTQFSIAGLAADGLHLAIPRGFNFFLLVHFVLNCVFPVIWINWLLVWLSTYHGSKRLELRSAEKGGIVTALTVESLVSAVYTIVSVVLSFVFLPRILPVLPGLNIDIDRSLNILFVTAGQRYEYEGIWGLSFVAGMVALVLYIVFQPKVKIVR